MNCPKCGLELKEEENVCPICQNDSEVVVEVKVNNSFEDYKESERLNEKYGFNKLLIFSILEVCCCNQVFGLIAIILLFLKLKNAINQRNFEEADMWQRNIRLILIIGLAFGILLGSFQLIFNLLPVIIEVIALR